MKASDLDTEQLIQFDPDRGRISLGGGRALLTRVEGMGLLRRELIETLGMDIVRGILMRYGYRCGRFDCEELETRFPWDSEEEWILAGPRMHALEGIVRVEPQTLRYDRTKGEFLMEGAWHDSYEAEQHLLHLGTSTLPVCWTLTGYASGYASAFFGSEVICLETECRGKGDTRCAFRIREAEAWGNHGREATQALQSRDLDRVRHLDRLATIGVLASGVAHEVGTPLNVILSRAEMLQSVLPTGSPGHEDASQIVRQIERISGILNRYLGFSRPQQQKIHIVDMNRLVLNVLEFLRHRLKRGKTVVNLRLDPNLPSAQVDPEQIQQVLINLVVNAIEAMSDGGALRIATHLVFAGDSDGEAIEIEVGDTGCGIQPGDVERIFQPFYSTKGGAGTGLGLSIASRILRDHGGSISATSSVGEGSSFRVRLPLESPLAAADDSIPAPKE